MNTPTRVDVLTEGRRKGLATNAAKARSKRQAVEVIIDQMDRTSQPLTNTQIAKQSGVGKNYLTTSAPQLGQRAASIRSRISEHQASEALTRRNEIAEHLASENRQLNGRVKQLKGQIRQLQRELADTRTAALSQQHGSLDPATGEILQDHNQELLHTVSELESDNRKLTMERDTAKAEKNQTKRNVDAKVTALNEAKRIIERLQKQATESDR